MYYLKRHNVKDFSIEQCTSYDSSAPLAEYERTTCEVVDEGGNVVFVALAH